MKVAAFLWLVWLSTTVAFGATCTTTSTTTWDCGTPGQNDDLIVNHSITIIGDFTVNNGSITVNSPNTLTVTGNLTFNNNSTVLVNNGGCIHVEGNFTNKNNSGDIEIFGTLMVDGDFVNGTGSGTGAIIDVGSTGSITYGGICDNPGTVEDDSGTYSGDCDNPILPVELVGFGVTATELGNLLQWETASERGNDFFEVHRSANTQDWEIIASLEGAGNSDQIIGYQYLDANPPSGRVFYRLRQVDFDGSFDFSFIVSVVTGALPAFKILKIFPNPTKSRFEVFYVTDNRHQVIYKIIAPNGKITASGNNPNQYGSNSLQLSLPDNVNGVYILRLENNGIAISSKILKTN